MTTCRKSDPGNSAPAASGPPAQTPGNGGVVELAIVEAFGHACGQRNFRKSTSRSSANVVTFRFAISAAVAAWPYAAEPGPPTAFLALSMIVLKMQSCLRNQTYMHQHRSQIELWLDGIDP